MHPISSNSPSNHSNSYTQVENRPEECWLKKAFSCLRHPLPPQAKSVSNSAQSTLFSTTISNPPTPFSETALITSITSMLPLDKNSLEMIQQQLTDLSIEELSHLETTLKTFPDLLPLASSIKKITLLFVLLHKLKETKIDSPPEPVQFKQLINSTTQIDYGLNIALSSSIRKDKSPIVFSSQLNCNDPKIPPKSKYSPRLSVDHPLYALINTSTLCRERKSVLTSAAAELTEQLSTIQPGLHLYVCEGATAACTSMSETTKSSETFRASTDPDENIALKIIAEVTTRCNQQSIIVVPDRYNKQNTIDFLRLLGFDARAIEENISSPLIVASSSADDCDIESLSHFIDQKSSYTLTVLGPPLGRSAELIKPNCSRIDIQGAIETVPYFEDLPLFDAQNNIIGKSTNTRNSASKPFFLKAVERPIWHMHSSAAMGLFALSFEEFHALSKGMLLFTEKDKEHWMSNTEAQFATGYPAKDTKLPGSMLAKRLANAEILNKLYREGTTAQSSILSYLRKDPQKRVLGLQLFLETLVDREPNDGIALVAAEENLSYASFDWQNDDAISQTLNNLACSFRERLKREEGTDLELESSLAICSQLIEKLTPLQRQAALMALLAAFKNIYEEKTANGWEEALKSARNPLQWSVFEAAYKRCGKQVAYDAIAVLCARLGIQLSEDPSIGDKVLLLCC